MNMNLSELINEILSEWAYRVDDGQPNPKNKKHLAELSIVLSEMGLSHIKEELFENITEADKNFKNAILNKEIPYKSADGTQKKGIVGNLLRLPKDSPGRVAAEKLMPPEGSEERDSAMKDLGSEKDGKSTGGDKEKGKEDEKPKDGEQPQGGGEEEKAKAAQAMFDPKADPAMGARMDREKAANDKLAQKDKENKEAEADAEKSTNSETPEGEYKPLETPPPQNEKGVVDADGKISGTEIDAESKLDDVPKSFLDKISTKMGQFYSHFKDDRLQAEKKAMEVFGYTQQDVNRLSKDKDSAEFKAYDDEVKKNQEPTFNLCSISIPGTNLFCDGNKGITRDKMPQFKGKPEEGSQAWNELEAGKKSGKYKETDTEVEGEPFFRQLLADKDIKVTDATIASDSLKATQSELVGDKVMGMKSVLDKGPDHPAFKKITAPIFVSKDGYVVDGHHRWAAITAYNIDNPDNPLPMNVMIIDKDIDEAIDISNEFANNFGVAAKSGKQTGPQSGENPEPPKDEPSRPNAEPATDKSGEGSIKAQTKTFKGESSGKEIKAVEFDGGAQIFGVQHRNTKMVDDIVNKVKSSIPEERWKDIVFLGEGGANDENGEMKFNDEQIHASEEFKKMGATIDSWDGDDMDVHNSESKLYKKQKEKTGLEDNQILAGNWASMVGQGEGEGLDPNDPDNRMKAEDYLDDNGKQFLQDAAKEAGLPPIENWDNPTGEKPSEENDWKGTGDRGTLYRLSFPKDNGDKETKINDIQVAFNETRDENLLEKTKELQAQGKIPISIAGEGHVDLVDDMIKSKNAQPKAEKPEEKLPEPEEPSKEDGGVIYNVGGNYYSDSPDGPAQYVKTESVVEKVLIEGDETWAYLLFEATVTKTTSGGKTVKVKTIPPKNQKKATVVAKAKEKKETKPTKSTGVTKAAPTKKTKKFVATPEDKARLKYRKEELAKIVAAGLIPTQKKKLSGAGVFVPTEKQMQALLEVTKKQIEDPEYRLPLPKYDVSEEDIDIAIETMKEILKTEFSSVYNSIKKAGGVDSKLTTREAGNQRVRDIIKKYLETGGRSAITGEFVPFNQMQLDHHVPYSSAAQRVADKKKKGIETTLLAEQDELDSPENWDLMETPLNQLKNALEGNALIERINKKLSASPDEKEKKELETELKNVRRRALLTSLVTSFGNGDYSGISEETLEKFNQDEMNVICKAWNWYHPNSKDADQFREIDPKYDETLKKRGIDTSVRHPLSITRGVAQQGGARGRGQIKPVAELRKSFLAVVRQAGIKLMTKKDVKKTDLALAKAVRDVETATKPQTDKINQLKQKIKQQTAQSKK
jgi:hypothetical protein